MDSSSNQSAVSNATDLNLFSGSIIELQNFSLIAASIVVFVLSVPLTLLSFAGALKWTITKDGTIINYIIVYYTSATFLSCFVSQIAMLLRAVAWYTDKINAYLTCGFTHISMVVVWSSFNFGLTAVVVLRYIFILHPLVVTKITMIRKSTMALLAVVFVCITAALGVADCYFNKNSVYKLCVGTFTSSTRDISQTLLANYLVPAFLFPIILDACLVIRILHRCKTMIGVFGRTQKKQQNLLTFRGAILCRVITLLPFFSLVITLYIIPTDLNSFDEYFYFHILMLCCFVCGCIIVPLCTIINSTFIKSEILQLCCGKSSERRTEICLDNISHGIHIG